MLLTFAAAQLQRLCDFPTEGWEERKDTGAAVRFYWAFRQPTRQASWLALSSATSRQPKGQATWRVPSSSSSSSSSSSLEDNDEAEETGRGLPMINLKIAVSGVQMLSQGIQSQCKYAIKELLRAYTRALMELSCSLWWGISLKEK